MLGAPLWLDVWKEVAPLPSGDGLPKRLSLVFCALLNPANAPPPPPRGEGVPNCGLEETLPAKSGIQKEDEKKKPKRIRNEKKKAS